MIIQEKDIRRIFTISVLLKAANAVLEIVVGAILFFTSRIADTIVYLIQQELVDDPTDFLANTAQHYLPYLSQHSQLFASFYLLSHGIVKIFLAVGLLKRKLWAYPTSIVVLVFFITYQIHRYTYTHSLFLILLTVFDLVMIWLTWHEYKVIKSHLKTLEEMESKTARQR